jgi:cell division protein FtsI/penicillin-binding protein 2
VIQKRIFRALFLLLFATPGAGQPGEPGTLGPIVTEVMAGKAGAVVVVDVSSGRILAQSNLKMAAQRVTAPGSTVKPFVLLELLQSGKLDPEQHLVCRRTLTLAGKRLDCTHSPAVTNLDAADAIAYSCNSYFAQAATLLNAADLADAYEKAGFTVQTGLVQQDTESSGRVVPARDLPHLQLQALGDWGVEITPLELLAAYRTLALHKLKNDLPVAKPLFDGLERSVQYGMAHSKHGPTGITAAGKTGTAAGIATPETHGFFVGYAPADKPEIVLVVYLEQGHGSDAADIAAPIFTAYAKGRAPAR